MKSLFGFALVASAALSTQAFADPYSCQADLVLRNGQIITTSIGDGFTRNQACQNALNQCQDDLLRYQQQGSYNYATCRLAGGYNPGPGSGPVTPVPGPFPPGPGPFPPGPGPFPPGPGPFPPGPGPFPPYPDNFIDISCASYNNGVNYCYVGAFSYDVRLVQRYSIAPCQLGRSYGLTGDYVWVSQGCRGTFRVYR